MKFFFQFLSFLFGSGIIGMFATSPTDMRAAVSDLGGGAEPGGEPDIFEGADDGTAVNDGGDDRSSEGSESEDSGEDTGDGSDEAEPVDGEESADEGGEEEAGEDSEGAEEGADEAGKGEGEGEGKDKGEIDPATGKPKVAAKPLTEEEKKIEATLQELYRQTPKLKEAFKTYPELRAPFFKAVEINKIYPGGIQEAQQAKQWASDLFKIDSLYYGSGPQDVESKRNFLKLMWEESLGPDGQSTGHYETVAELINTDILNNFEAQVAAQGPQLAAAIAKDLSPKQVSTAIEIVRRGIALLTGKTPSSAARPAAGAQPSAVDIPNSENMTPREKQLAQQLATLTAKLQEKTQSDSATAEKVFHESIWNNFYSGIKGDIDKRMPASVKVGSELLQKWFVNDVISKLQEGLRADEFFDAQLKAVARSGDRGQDHVAKLGTMIKQRALTLLPSAVLQVTDALQVKAAANNKSQGTTRRTGNERPRREPALGGTPGRVVKGSGRPDRSSGQRQPGTLRSSGDYTRDANKLLGLE